VLLAVQIKSAAAQPISDKKVDMSELMKISSLHDVVLGSMAAKVTIVEYASMTCSHCARFHTDTLPAFKKKYIDTGKVKFILREFPLDPLATAAFMLGRCREDDKREALLDFLFEKQKNWAFVDRPLDALFGLIKQAGISQESAEICLKKQDLRTGITQIKERGAALGVQSTPSFFIQGQLYSGALSLEELDKILKPLLGE
jgi:protein-disulfide isomerase